MPNNVDLEPAVVTAKQGGPLPDGELAVKAMECARAIVWAPGRKTSQHFVQRLKKLNDRMHAVFAEIGSAPEGGNAAAEEHRWLAENMDLLRSDLAGLQEARISLTRTEHVRRPDRELAPRVLVVAENLLAALNYRFADSTFSEYLRAFQTAVVLRQSELWQMVPAVKLVLLERIAELATRMLAGSAVAGISDCIRSLREVGQAPWNDLLEQLIVFDRVLRRDPARAYPRMDALGRQMYRQAVARMAEYSDYSETEIAEMAISLARQSAGKPERDARLALRKSHVGYYLLAEGREQLYRRANVRPPLHDRVQEFLRRHPDEFYLLGIEVLTLSMVLAALWWVSFSSLGWALLAAIALLIPCSQSAVQIMSHLTTSLLVPQPLPKLDFTDGIPEECTTMVVVPTLLLNERQVRQLVKELEVRYVANMSANLHFALLTDLADSAEQPREDDPLVELCGELIRELNRKYAASGAGTFAMFHRHRVYNRREGVWMGWERKRGKLLDFNQLILGYYDSFPYKVGDLSVLSSIRYLLTLDSDTELPRGAARRLIGTLAHPLCQAIIDREQNIVTHGYGMLQPRVGVSVQSTAQSRLASIYSGRTGFDIYTRAISDVYQDLYGEGSFVGKGLYELRTVHHVLNKRFPRNAILSHDLIEGAYTRAGLVSDVEVIDHYPSHYSAYTRRKHRWVRGDWQIMEWLFSRVPDESGRRVSNPISFVSRWKILDNLRRSMVEPATLALFLMAWILLPGRPLYWTLVSLGILFAPAVFELAAGLLRAALGGGGFSAAKDALVSFATGTAGILLSLAFLVHDALVATDAIWRSLYRTVVSRKRLLQWETAAEAELGTKKRTPLDRYLLGTPAIAVAVGILLFFSRRSALWVAVPLLLLWACSKLISLWLDRPPRIARRPTSRKDELFLRRAAVRTWRYFAELSTEEHNWLIPDNLQDDPAQIAARVSPTNLGFLLNARQVACELGYLTAPEFAGLTRHTLETMNRLRSYRGHLFNWYDTRTLAPLAPLFVSSVDSGNLAAALATLNHGCRALLEKPLLSPALLNGYDDHLRALVDLKALSSRRIKRSIRPRKNLRFPQRISAVISDAIINGKSSPGGTEAQWFTAQLGTRRERLQAIMNDYMPWLLPEFESARHSLGIDPALAIQVPLAQLPGFIADLQTRLAAVHSMGPEEERQCERLLALLGEARTRSISLMHDLEDAAGDAERWFGRMDFSFLLEGRRKLLSIGYDVDAGKLHSACYDLLASESRMATFVGIAKGEIPQEVWLKLGRTHVPNHGVPTLISWAGTMFEYLMPAIWMQSYPDTLLQRSMEGAVIAQQAYTEKKGIPWGVSESAYCELNEAESYRYRTFGVPALALQSAESERLVVTPYAGAMALAVNPVAALENLRRMDKSGWFGKYGFYEAADYGPAESFRRREWRLVKSWMAHHQGMILLAVANFLCGDVVRHWFHDDVYVQGTELLLQERTVLHRVRPAWHLKPPVVPERTPTVSGGELALES